MGLLESVIPGWEKKYGIPEFVKNAEYSADSFSGFPSATRADIWKSYLKTHLSLTGLEKESKLKELKARADKIDFSLAVDLDEIDEVFATQEKEAQTAESFPIRNANEWEAANNWLLSYERTIDENSKLEVANKLIATARGFGKDASERVYTLAEQAFTDTDLLLEEIEKRHTLAKSAELIDLKLAVNSDDYAVCLYPHRVKECLAAFDQEHRLEQYYGRKLKTPHDVAYSLSAKKAEDALTESCCLTNGSVYQREDLSILDSEARLSKLAELFGEDFVDQLKDPFGHLDIEKAAEILPTLPKPDADLFDTVITTKKGSYKVDVDKFEQIYDAFACLGCLS